MLKQKAKIAVVWSGADILLRQGLQFGVSVALARMLSPAEFGTVALLYLFTGIAIAFVDSGFSAALVQRQDVTRTDESTVFWFNVAMALVVASALAASAHAIARLFGQAALVPLVYAMALNIVITALGSVHGTLLSKRLDFKTQMKIGGIAVATSGVVAIALAWQGYGVWALAGQTLAASLVTTVLLWVFSGWRPAAVFSPDSVKRLFGFGGYMLASGLLNIAYTRIYTLLIGRFYGVQELGYYSRADTTKQFPVDLLTGILARVAFPIFSAATHDVAQLRRGVRIALRGMMLINVPMMLGLAVTASSTIQVLFGEKWLPAVPVMQILCIGGILWPLHVINLNVLMAQGHSNLFFRIEVIKNVLGISLLSVGSAFGIIGIAWSQVVFGIIAFLINAHYSRAHLTYGAADQVRDILPIVVLAMLTTALVHSIELVWQHDSVALLLAAQVVCGSAAFLIFAWLFRLTALQDAVHFLARDKPTISSAAAVT